MQEKKHPHAALQLHELTAISPLDGRYRNAEAINVADLAPEVSEYSLIKTRVEIEAKYLIALSKAGVVRSLSSQERKELSSFSDLITLEKAEEIKKVEDTTKHDVKAMEIVFRELVAGTSLEDLTEKIHFGLTSEDVNNLAYRLLLQRATTRVVLPELTRLLGLLVTVATQHKQVPMLARTHGQAAVPTTLGHEFGVFSVRLDKQINDLASRRLTGKLNGAVGTFNALYFVYPDVNWMVFSEDFVSSFDLQPNLMTTQINPYDDVAEYLQNYQRINGILIGFDQDMWRYISDDWFVQETRQGERGSSTMPQKVNPIRFENSEANLGMAIAMSEFLARKLQVSRLQRDLSDSTAIRNIGSLLGYSLLAYRNTIDGMKRVKPNGDKIAEQLTKDWTILAEGVQTYLRDQGFPDAYTLLVEKTRGKRIGEGEWKNVIQSLPVDEVVKKKLATLTPQSYIGLAVELTDRTIKRIQRKK